MKNKTAYLVVQIATILVFVFVTTTYDLNPTALFFAFLGLAFISQWAFKHFIEPNKH